MDIISKERRSETMRRIRARNTAPEIAVRKLVTRLGYKYRLHVTTLPGRPDLVFRRLHKVIFVHGCFWHQHHGCRDASTPKSNRKYWRPKLLGNKVRDRRHVRQLKGMGWDILVLWECEVDNAKVAHRVARFLRRAERPINKS
jgi:DNA mismatch endonuclease (patch repair protein)